MKRLYEVVIAVCLFTCGFHSAVQSQLVQPECTQLSSSLHGIQPGPRVHSHHPLSPFSESDVESLGPKHHAQRPPDVSKPRLPLSGANVFVIDTAIMNSNDTARGIYSFNARGRVDTALYQLWSNGQWVNTELYTYTYDANGHDLTYLWQSWLNGQWVDSELDTYTYDTSGHELTSLWHTRSNGQLVNYELFTYTYDANGHWLTELGQSSLSNGEWLNFELATYTYDASGHLLTELGQYWSGQWLNDMLDTYTYDANGHNLTFLGQSWSNGQWMNSTLSTYTYDANGHVLTELVQDWSGQWLNDMLDTYTYDANGHNLTFLGQSWSNGQWMNSALSTYTYDANGKLITFQSSVWHDSSWVPNAAALFVSDSAGNSYVFGGYSVLLKYKESVIAGVASQMKGVPKQFTLGQNYPNPFNPTTTIHYELPKELFVRLSLFNVLGQEVKTLVNENQPPGEKSVRFDGSNLPSGMYFYRITAGPFIDVKKMLLLR